MQNTTSTVQALSMFVVLMIGIAVGYWIHKPVSTVTEKNATEWRQLKETDDALLDAWNMDDSSSSASTILYEKSKERDVVLKKLGY